MSEPAEIQRLAGEMLQEVLRRTHLSAASDLATILAEEARAIGVDPVPAVRPRPRAAEPGARAGAVVEWRGDSQQALLPQTV